MVVSFVHFQVEVGKGVVAFLVVNIHERCYLRECCRHVFKECQGAFLIAIGIVVELYQNHPLASIGVPYHDVTQQAVLFPEVEVGHACSLGVAVNLVAYVVMQVVHEVTFLDRIYFVKSTSDMKA